METVRVAEVSLEDVGPFERMQISFPKKAGLSLICGDNGIGKSTVLEAVAALFMQGQLTRLKRRQAASRGTISGNVAVDGNSLPTQLNLQHFNPDETDWANGSLMNYSRSVIQVRAARDIFYSRQQAILRDPVVDQVQLGQRLSNGLDGSEIKAWFSNRWLLRHHAEESNWTEEMKQNLASAISYFSLLDPQVTLSHVDVRTFEIIVATPSGNLPFEYLSSGFRSAYILLLGILKEIEFRGLGASAETFSGVILIDEVDLHLHPSWQREIGGALKKAFPQAQIIASTHSPHVIQAAQSSEVIALVREPGGIVKTRIVPSAKYGYAGWTVEEVLEEIMGVEDTKTPVFRKAVNDFDDAVDKDDPPAVIAALTQLREMLHPKNPLRKLLEIQASPYVGAVSSDEAFK